MPKKVGRILPTSAGFCRLSHLDGWGRVVLPADYAADHVALASAVTVQQSRKASPSIALCSSPTAPPPASTSTSG